MPPVPISSSAIAWLSWSNDAFARARTEQKPVLLSISAAWCQWCREMDRTSYADPAITAVINNRFVPIRVDADHRPDISERYNLGGWPTTAFLSPDGGILGGGTFVPVERMSGVLAQVIAAFEARGGSLPMTVAQAAPDDATGPDTINATDLYDSVFASFDDQNGGFGDAPKFPHAAPVRLAMDLWRETHDERFERIVVTTLDAMGWGGLYDEVDGGFFRCATSRDWQVPRSEKLLDANATLMRLYLDAGDTLEIGRFTERAADILRYLQTCLADPVDGGWSASQEADDAYYAAGSSKARRALNAPGVPRVLYTDANATMVSAALQAARAFDDADLTAFAIKSLERVLLVCYKPGGGVAHYFEREPCVRGLLADQLAMTSANLDAFEVSGNVVYEMMALELAHYAVRVLWDETHGGFFDAADDAQAIGLMRQRVKPFAANCDAARILRRLAETAKEPEFSAVAERTLHAMAPRAIEQGPLGAHYALAMRDARPR
jgi:uncharacterized protein YyaL (SSP411 family)